MPTDYEQLNKVRFDAMDLLRTLQAKEDNPRDEAAYELLIGAGFCLWRVAFMTDVALDFHASRPHARAFLQGLLDDNAVTFRIEKDCRDWTAAFYLNSAEWRVMVAGRRLHVARESSGSHEYDSVERRIAVFETAEGQSDGKTDAPVHTRWKTAHAGAMWLANKL